MKFLNYLFILLLAFSCSEQTGEKNEKPEVIHETSIVNDEIFNNPFDFDQAPREYLCQNWNCDSEFEVFQNRHVDNQTDTVFKIMIGDNQFDVYKTSSESWIKYANIKTDLFNFNGLEPGMKLGKVLSRLNDVSGQNMKILDVNNTEQTNRLRLIFENEVLTNIEFFGYVD